MSAHSFPSLTSDSSSVPSATSDLNLNDDQPQPTVSSGSRSLHALSFKDPDASAEVIQLRDRVSKLEQDKFVLGDYAAELQSRIRELEQERMDNPTPINQDREADPSEKAQSQSTTVRPSPLHYSTPTSQSRGSGPFRTSNHRPSSSLSAVTSTTTRRALAHVPSHSQAPSPTPSQLAFPSSTSRLRLVPKRGTRPLVPEPSHSPTLDPFSDDSRQHSTNHTSTPTRRRLKAMCGRLSLDATPRSPSLKDGKPSIHVANDYEQPAAREAHATRTYNTMPSRHENGHHDTAPETKHTTFTSKLDSVILTSKFFPLSSSRSKAPESIPRNHHSHHGLTAAVPLNNDVPSSSLRAGNVFLDSPPKQHVKVKVVRKANPSLSHSLGLEENRHPDVQPRIEERKSRSRGRVSFSERLFASPSERGDETEADNDPSGSPWGSWGRKRRAFPLLSYQKEKRTTATTTPPSTPPTAFSSRFARSRAEGGGEPDEKRYDSRRSLAAGCLRFVSGSNRRDKSSERIESRVLRRSHSEFRKSRSHSRSHSPPQDRVRHNYGSGPPKIPLVKDKDEKHRITPSRVGSPKPKGRVSDLQQVGAELERTSSLRSTGKWGQRGRAFTHEVTRRRTIHPMFSFERPGSAAASTSSSRRADADDEETVDGHRAGGTGPRAGIERSSRRARREVRVEGSLHSHPPHVQDDSGASGNTGLTLARSESASTHKGKGPMMRTRLGVQTHGTFAFEPAAAVVIPPRSAPPHGVFASSAQPSDGTHAQAVGRHLKAKSEPADERGKGVAEDTRDQVYRDFCDDLRVVLGDGEEWTSFTKYIRRFDIEVLTTDVLLRRVKKLIDGSPSANQSTKLNLYDRFVNIVNDNVEAKVCLGS